MSTPWLNGRQAEPWEILAIEQGWRDARERDLELLAGLLTECPRVPRPEETVRRVEDIRWH